MFSKSSLSNEFFYINNNNNKLIKGIQTYWYEMGCRFLSEKKHGQENYSLYLQNMNDKFLNLISETYYLCKKRKYHIVVLKNIE